MPFIKWPSLLWFVTVLLYQEHDTYEWKQIRFGYGSPPSKNHPKYMERKVLLALPHLKELETRLTLPEVLLIVQCVTGSLKGIRYTWMTLAPWPVWFYQSGWGETLVQPGKRASFCKLHRNQDRDGFRGCTFSKLVLISKREVISKSQE